MKKAFFVIFSVLFLDQALKVWVKTHMFLGQEYEFLGGLFILHFTENNGMAFGMELAGEYGKLFLSVFRIAAVAGIGWYLYSLIKSNAPSLAVISIALVFSGAIGNIIDSAFYGMIFSESYGEVARVFPSEGGYATFLHGRVVDMLYFPIIEGHFPEWFPIWANEHFLFFRPVFNISDAAITCGVALILLFQRKFFMSNPAETTVSKTEENQPQN